MEIVTSKHDPTDVNELAVGDRFGHSCENFETNLPSDRPGATPGPKDVEPRSEFDATSQRTEEIVQATQVLFGRMIQEIRARE